MSQISECFAVCLNHNETDILKRNTWSLSRVSSSFYFIDHIRVSCFLLILHIPSASVQHELYYIMYRSAAVNHDHLLQYMVNFNPIDKDYILRWQSDLENTKERPLHKIKENLPHWAELEIVRNCAYLHQADIKQYKKALVKVRRLGIGFAVLGSVVFRSSAESCSVPVITHSNS